MLARPACQPSALAQQEDQNPRGPRELFQKWALSVEHPVKGWLDGHWLRRGDDREGYADEYVQGLWVAFKAFGARPADQQAEPVAAMYEDGSVLTRADCIDDEVFAICCKAQTPLYRHAQPATAKVDERLVEATAFVQKLRDAAAGQPTVASGYLSDILDVLRGCDKPNSGQA
ncbi:Uncharacterized protein ALO43_03328 [Pseudomonas tremae]|uniref:Uncharacterized protein n=2 Tax=Pseudomonas TaxID=286 RepID=A0AA40NZQ5_9PSED|nr:Uncharacterized protein ALO43_03328 [Pseudomonas tremae]RMO02846.1 hypothetical protein ALQ48_03897 [Pseudomonas coronafaciens pv. zizaniae]